MYNDPVIAISAGAGLSVVLLFVCHLVLWPYREQLHIVAKYTIGVSMLLIGIALSAWLLDLLFVVFVPVIISGAGGVTLASLYWWRRMQHLHKHQRDEKIDLANQARGVNHAVHRE